ncbi:MAG: hypothetical protein AAF216_09740 [Pseudomonadota bacterium]
MTRKEKKSESLDVRLPHSVKRRLMDTAQERGETASEAVRRFIHAYIDETPTGHPSTPFGSLLTMAKPHITKLAAMSGAIAAGAFALTLMPVAVADEAVFERLDKNADGAITPGEIAPGDDAIFDLLDTDGSGTITPDEFSSETNIVTVSNSVKIQGEGAADMRVITVDATEIDLSETGKVRVYTSTNGETVELDTTNGESKTMIIDLREDKDPQITID